MNFALKVVRFSHGHSKHEAMEAAGLFESAWPPMRYPPHRAHRMLAARILGGGPSEAEEREHAVIRSEELRQYYERVFRLPLVVARCDLEELVGWVGDGPETIESHADDTWWESPVARRRASEALNGPLVSPSPVRSVQSAFGTPSEVTESVRSYANMVGEGRHLFMDMDRTRIEHVD